MTETKERRLAISKELFAALRTLPAEARQAFAVFMNRFRMGEKTVFLALPGASDYERVRVKGNLEIVLKRAGGLHLLLNIGTPEAIEAWAKRFRCEVNEKTGAVQLYEAAPASETAAEPERGEAPGAPKALEAPQPDQPAQAAQSAAPLFEKLSDEALAEIGLPKERLLAVRDVRSALDLEHLQPLLPDSVYEALTWYAQGESWESIRGAYAEAAADEKALVPTEIGKLDISRFRIVETDEELRAIMDKPLAEWRVFLHPTQKRIVDAPWHGAVKVTGGAGTGKTVAALHRARHLVRLPDWKASDRLLFTTFTKNLALDLEEQLGEICTKEEMKRIRVQNIDAWLASFIRQHGVEKTIVYPKAGEENLYETCWRAAWGSFSAPAGLRLSESFCRAEWEEVVLPQHVNSLRDYLFADRRGRGVSLTRMERKALWPLFEDMRLELNLHDAMTQEDAAAFAAEELRKTYPDGFYRAVVADEIQDFSPDMLKLLRAMARDVSKSDPPVEGDLFLAGDPHQRIYGRPVSFGACGIEIRGRSRKLRVNYRTTDEIRKTAEAVYRGRTVDNLEGEADEATGYASLRHGAAPIAHLASTFADEVKWIAGTAKSLIDSGEYASEEICIALRTNRLAADYASALEAQGLAIEQISRSRADDPEKSGVRIATVHRIKGLEFKVVFIAGMEPGKFPLDPPKGADPAQKASCEAEERALFYVAASRASNLLFFSAAGKGSRFFPAEESFDAGAGTAADRN